MSDFEKWFRSLNANGKTVYFLGNEHKASEMAWNHQQAIIDDLKAQLNNMEACYVERKMEAEELQKTNISLEAGLRKNSKNKQKLLGKNIELQKRIDEYEKLTTSMRNEFDLWSDDSEFADVIEAQIENLEALRGAND